METEKKRDCEERQSGEEEVIFCLSLPADTQSLPLWRQLVLRVPPAAAEPPREQLSPACGLPALRPLHVL